MELSEWLSHQKAGQREGKEKEKKREGSQSSPLKVLFSSSFLSCSEASAFHHKKVAWSVHHLSSNFYCISNLAFSSSSLTPLQLNTHSRHQLNCYCWLIHALCGRFVWMCALHSIDRVNVTCKPSNWTRAASASVFSLSLSLSSPCNTGEGRTQQPSCL